MLILLTVISRADLLETVYRLCHQRAAGVPLHAQEQVLVQVPHLEAGHLAAV